MIFILAIKKTFKSKILIFLCGSITAIYLYIRIAREDFGLSLLNSIFVGILIVAAIIVLHILYYILKMSLSFLFSRDNGIYGKSQILLRDISYCFNKLKLDPDLNDDKLVQAIANKVCVPIKLFFNIKTNSKCAISVKLFENLEENPLDAKVYTVCRDRETEKKYKEWYDKLDHSIKNYTCLYTIMFNIGKGKEESSFYYFNNNLPETDEFDIPTKTMYIKNDETEDNNSWSLHKSEIVVPLYKLLSHDKKPKIIGFLCLTSKEINVFNKKYDIAIMQNVAICINEVIYDIFFDKRNLELERVS